MVLDKKNNWDESKHRWVNPNEIVIEDLSEKEIMFVAQNLVNAGYKPEYWKAKDQASGHLHIKDIELPKELLEKQKGLDEGETCEEVRAYKKAVIKKYVPSELHDRVDWNFTDTKRHRIAKENEEHFKGYGKKELIKSWKDEGDKNPFEPSLEIQLPKKHLVKASTSDWKEVIEKVIPQWIVGERQKKALNLAGYLRKKGAGIHTVIAVITEVCNRTQDNDLKERISAVRTTFEKDLNEIKGSSGLEGVSLYEEPVKKNTSIATKPLEVLTYNDLKKFEVNKNFIVDGFLYPGTVNMVYSPPAQFKSLISAGLGFAVSNGKTFLGMETKKHAVLYLDGENSQGIMKERAEAIHKGMGLTRNQFPLFFVQGGLLMDSKKNIQQDYLVQIEELIKKEDIKVIIFDTLHRFCLYDENSSDDLNKLYTQVFKPLADELGVAVVFLHHSTKSGGYRGSGDFLGMVDVSYQVKRKSKTDEFTIVNEKCRSGEVPEIKGEIYFGEDVIRFRRLNEELEDEKKINKMKEVTERIYELFDEESQLKPIDIISFLEAQNFDYGSKKTVQRALKFLVETKKSLTKTERGAYSLALE